MYCGKAIWTASSILLKPKPRAANHCLCDTNSTPAMVNLSVWTCLLMVWPLPAGQGGFTVAVSRTDTCIYLLYRTFFSLRRKSALLKLWEDRPNVGTIFNKTQNIPFHVKLFQTSAIHQWNKFLRLAFFVGEKNSHLLSRIEKHYYSNARNVTQMVLRKKMRFLGKTK